MKYMTTLTMVYRVPFIEEHNLSLNARREIKEISKLS
jgi:hypothetical protein